jgi:hypothetical protein
MRPARLDADWHRTHGMPANATMDQRIAWHVAHQKACSCRPIPAGVVAAMKARGLDTTARRRPAKKR